VFSTEPRDDLAAQIAARPAEERVDALEHSIGYSVFQRIGLDENLVPLQAEHPDQEQLHQPVPTHDLVRMRGAMSGERRTIVLRPVDEAMRRESFERGHDVLWGCPQVPGEQRGAHRLIPGELEDRAKGVLHRRVREQVTAGRETAHPYTPCRAGHDTAP
jgi:hypothetical protein